MEIPKAQVQMVDAGACCKTPEPKHFAPSVLIAVARPRSPRYAQPRRRAWLARRLLAPLSSVTVEQPHDSQERCVFWTGTPAIQFADQRSVTPPVGGPIVRPKRKCPVAALKSPHAEIPHQWAEAARAIFSWARTERSVCEVARSGSARVASSEPATKNSSHGVGGTDESVRLQFGTCSLRLTVARSLHGRHGHPQHRAIALIVIGKWSRSAGTLVITAASADRLRVARIGTTTAWLRADVGFAAAAITAASARAARKLLRSAGSHPHHRTIGCDRTKADRHQQYAHQHQCAGYAKHVHACPKENSVQ